MDTIDTEKPIVVIVGPTASGKTGLAIQLARLFGGEILCADSRTVYRGMDIGTAKPGMEERAGVQHWGLDLVEPGERFTAADFKSYATRTIEDIRSRGKIPFIVGGTGLYVDAILFDYQFGNDVNNKQRETLEKMTIEQLTKYCINNNIKLPENVKNKRHLVRSIELNNHTKQRRSKPIDNVIIVGITTDGDELKHRIHERIEQLFSNGVVDEANFLGKKYGWDSEAMTGNIYRIVHEMTLGRLSDVEAKQRAISRDWKLAKRQRTWFKRNPFIQWLSLKEAESYLQKVLSVL